MNVRQKFRAIMAGKRLVLMPGAYDALSARIMEAEGFEAICAGGYAAIGSMLAQPDMGQSNMRDYADHYGRICGGGRGTGLCRRRHRIRRRQQCPADGARVRSGRRRRHFHQRSGVSQSLRLSARQTGDPGRADAGQGQGRARCAAGSRIFSSPHARTPPAVEGLNAAIARCQLFMEAGADMAKPMGVRHDRRDQARDARNSGGPHMATLSQAAGNKRRSLEDLEAAGVVAATFPSIALFAAANAVRNVLRILKRENSLTATFDHLLAARRLLRAGRAQGDAGARGELRQSGCRRSRRSARPSSAGRTPQRDSRHAFNGRRKKEKGPARGRPFPHFSLLEPTTPSSPPVAAEWHSQLYSQLQEPR